MPVINKDGLKVAYAKLSAILCQDKHPSSRSHVSLDGSEIYLENKDSADLLNQAQALVGLGFLPPVDVSDKFHSLNFTFCSCPN